MREIIATVDVQGGGVTKETFESGFNSLEKDFALYLEKTNALHWWHRVAARQDYFLQGWRRQRVYPDFVACRKADGKLLILETKGIHLKGGEDTDYKEKLLTTLEEAYSTAITGPVIAVSACRQDFIKPILISPRKSAAIQPRDTPSG